jgi:hypothetical protein
MERALRKAFLKAGNCFGLLKRLLNRMVKVPSSVVTRVLVVSRVESLKVPAGIPESDMVTDWYGAELCVARRCYVLPG